MNWNNHEAKHMTTQNPKLATMIKDLAVNLKPAVDEIEGSIPTTQGHYGRYMAVLAIFAKGNKLRAQIIALALIEAGANKTGVHNALRLAI